MTRPSPSTGLTDLSACELASAIRSRQCSCRDVMLAYLAQMRKFNARVNALVSLREPEVLLKQADQCDTLLAQGRYLGWMHGMPAAPKDIPAVAGMPTTQGSVILRNTIPAADAILVERMRRSGAIFVGRTNTPEFGLGSHTYNRLFGTTTNAFDTSLSAGGSSGGAAAALALHMLPVADGSDMMGSLRNPAAFNHVVGFRPSWGRVPAGPAPEVFFQQLTTEGPMGRSVADVARLLGVIAGYDVRAPLSLAEDPEAFTGPLESDVRGLRIGWLGDLGGYLPYDPGVSELCRAALKHFEALGCVVEAATIDFDMDRTWRAWLGLRSFLVAGRLRPWFDNLAHRQQMKPEAVWEVEQGLALPAQAVYQAAQERSAWYAALVRMFERFDLLALPSAQVFPFDARIDWPRTVGGRSMDTYHRWMEVVVPFSLAGVPVIGLPAGLDAAARPMGIQLAGAPRRDLDVLKAAHAYERQSGFSRVRSPLLHSPDEHD
jgi:amidase